jgi:hypothetical protein
MRILTSIIAAGLMMAGASVMAHGDGACKTEWKGCKGKKGPAMHQCMSDAATANKNQACLDDMAKHEKDKAGKE